MNKTNRIDEAVNDCLSLYRLLNARIKSIPISSRSIVVDRIITKRFKNSNEYFDFIKILIDRCPYMIEKDALLNLMKHVSECRTYGTEDDWL